MLTPGSKIGGFLIGDLLGKGAMGEVYKGEQLSLKRPVAIKRIAGHLLENEDMVKRFKREAQVLAKVGHPNVVGVIECEEFADASGEKHLLLIMELIEGGRSLKAHLGKPIDWRLATTVVRMCADGLAAAFEQHVVHRDIKPDNIMMTHKGIAKLVDFGLAKAAESTALTMQAAPMGTPLFMSPEACRGEEIGHAGDLYSLGVSWWYMLTGQYPFQSANLHGLLYKHISEPLPTPTGLFDHVPAPIVKLVYQCLEKDPANRPASAIKLVEAIESLPAQGLLIPRDARELIAAGSDGHPTGGATTAATLVSGGKVDRTAATIIAGGGDVTKAQEATAPTAVPNAARTVAGDLSPHGAVAATVVAHLRPQATVAPTVAAAGGKGGMIAAAVVAVLLLGGTGAWFATRGGEAPAKPATPKPESVSARTESPKPVIAVAPLPIDTSKPAGQAAKPTPVVEEAKPAAAAVAAPPAEPPKPIVEEPKPVVATVVAPPLEQPKPPTEPLKPEPPKPVVEAMQPAAAAPPAEAPKPAAQAVPPETPKPIDTSAFDAALASRNWKAAKAAADSLPEPARSEAIGKLGKAANAQIITTMKAAKGLYQDEKYQEAYVLLAADAPLAPYADKTVLDSFLKLVNNVRETAKQAQENP
jgi:tRNA A-37 threonylcarbamoyl transferase component Bud32